MPTLNLKVSPLQNPGDLSALAAVLTQLSAQHLGKRPEVTAVMIQDLPAAQWFIGGEAATQASAMLEISITAGTNTVEEKQAFIAASFAALETHIGAGEPLAQASYVIVRELPATDWGFGGHTQAARRTARAFAAW